MLENLYPHLARFHGLLGCLLLLAAFLALFIAFSGWTGRKPAGPGLFRVGLIFVLAMDLELISGLLLYFCISADVRGGFLGHGMVMFLAVLLAHIGGVLTRKAPTDVLKHRGAAIAWTIALLVMLAGIPRH